MPIRAYDHGVCARREDGLRCVSHDEGICSHHSDTGNGNSNNGNGNGNPFEGMTLPQVAAILFEEIVRVREELKGEITEVLRNLTNRINEVEKRLGERIDALHMTVHQNHTAFIAQQEQWKRG